jgi:hypothetical protein
VRSVKIHATSKLGHIVSVAAPWCGRIDCTPVPHRIDIGGGQGGVGLKPLIQLVVVMEVVYELVVEVVLCTIEHRVPTTTTTAAAAATTTQFRFMVSPDHHLHHRNNTSTTPRRL